MPRYFFRPLCCCLALVAWCEAARSADPDRQAAGELVPARVESSLATGNGQIRQFAFDGDAETFFASAGEAAAGDHLTLAWDKPVTLASIAVVTGRAKEDGDSLAAGTLEVSEDGQAFVEVAKFAAGAARAEVGKPARAVRIKAAADQKQPLVVREITLESTPAVAVFKYPIEFTIDVADAPEMKEWAEKVARICEGAYPMINEELRGEGYKPPHTVTMSLKKDYKGVAMASRGQITGSVKFFQDHPDDVGAMVHETAHIVQRYRGRGNPGWLVEGVADYVRFFKFEPGKLGRIHPTRSHYNGSYRVSAAFLAYLVEKYDKQLVLKLNSAMREGKYKDEMFKELTSKNLDELDEEWRATLGK